MRRAQSHREVSVFKLYYSSVNMKLGKQLLSIKTANLALAQTLKIGDITLITLIITVLEGFSLLVLDRVSVDVSSKLS